jgi:putative hydrolase of the HAD superfamily
LGIASNAQAYTGPELDAGLAEASLTSAVFAPDLVLWSWQLGFSKPDPYFFQVLLARLAARGIAPGEALMVGDRADNDIAPARAAGLMTWHLQAKGDGGWAALGAALRS